MCTLTLRFHFFLLLRFLPHTRSHTHALSLPSICGLCAAFLSRITRMLNICCEMFQVPFFASGVLFFFFLKKKLIDMKNLLFKSDVAKPAAQKHNSDSKHTQNTNKIRWDLQAVSSAPHPSGQGVLGCDGLLASCSS